MNELIMLGICARAPSCRKLVSMIDAGHIADGHVHRSLTFDDIHYEVNTVTVAGSVSCGMPQE